MSDAPIALSATDEFIRSASRQGSRRTVTNTAQAASNVAAYYDTIFAAMKEGKSESDAIENATEVIQALERKTKLTQVATMDVELESNNENNKQCVDQADEDDYESENSESQLDQDTRPGEKSHQAFKRLQSVLRTVATFSKIKKEAKAKKEPLEFHNIKELHKKLVITVNHYDSIMDRVLEDTEYQMENLFYEKLTETEEKFKAKLNFQYESLRSHQKCDLRIETLKKENDILKQELKDMMQTNSRMVAELKELKMYKTNTQAEVKLMSEKLANRKSYIRILTKKVKKLEECSELKCTATEGDQTCHESHPSDNEHSNQTTDIDEDISQEVRNEYMNAKISKPKWNISRKSDLLSKDIFSIMHKIENLEESCNEDPNEESLMQKIDKRYQNKIKNLKWQLESERREARDSLRISQKRSQKMKRIIQVLTDCLDAVHSDHKDTDSTVIQSDAKSLSSVSSRLRDVEAIYKRKELLQNLINGLSGLPAEYDCYSSTDKEESQICRDSRPSSAGIPSTKSMVNAPPIVPIQLKEEKLFTKKQKRFKFWDLIDRLNEFQTVKGWVIASKNRRAPSTEIMTVSLIESNIKNENEKIGKATGQKSANKPEVESIMRRQRPTSARTNLSQNSVRFAPNLEDSSSNATLRKPKRICTPMN